MGNYQEPEFEPVIIQDLGAEPSTAVTAGNGREKRITGGEPYFVAAWALTLLMLGSGAAWLITFDPGMAFGSYAGYEPQGTFINGVPASGPYPGRNILANYFQAAPLLLVAGMSASVLLLAVHGVLRNRR